MWWWFFTEGRAKGPLCFNISNNNQSDVPKKYDHSWNGYSIPRPPISSPLNILQTTRGQKALAWQLITICHRRWSSPSWLSVWWAAWTPAAPHSWWTCWCPLSFHKCICSLWTISALSLHCRLSLETLCRRDTLGKERVWVIRPHQIKRRSFWPRLKAKEFTFTKTFLQLVQRRVCQTFEIYILKKKEKFVLPLTIFSLLGDSGGLGRASFFFLVATPVTLRFLRVSVPQIITARFFVNLESPWVRCSWCHFSSSTQIPPPRCTWGRKTKVFEKHNWKLLLLHLQLIIQQTVCCHQHGVRIYCCDTQLVLDKEHYSFTSI